MFNIAAAEEALKRIRYSIKTQILYVDFSDLE